MNENVLLGYAKKVNRVNIFVFLAMGIVLFLLGFLTKQYLFFLPAV